MGVPWGCYGGAMRVLWGCYGGAMGVPWGAMCVGFQQTRPTSESRNIHGCLSIVIYSCYSTIRGDHLVAVKSPTPLFKSPVC